MKLVSFSLQNFRSIKRAEKIQLGNYTVLVGPNNEGKSNILRGLVAGIAILSRPTVTSNRPGSPLRPPAGGARFHEVYNWERDFPISLQEKTPAGKTVFDFDFELSGEEVEQFKQSVKSNLNGLLPIRLSIGKGSVEFEVKKRGRGATTLSNKRPQIARFVASHLNLRDIPSIRTASDAMSLVEEMISRELRQLEESADYRDAVEKIAELQNPILEELSETVRMMLATFLPDVKRVDIQVSDRYSALRRSSVMLVDDGTPTDLKYKGDGVQSLAAISLIHHISEQSAGESELVLAIEEPEAHLHPRAIHQLRSVLREIASRQQVVVTTHSPLLVNRAEVESNVIVDRNSARKARTIQEIRQTLGVRVSDSLSAAELVLVVEGECDRIAITRLLSVHSKILATAIASGRVGLDSMSGASNLGYKLSLLRDQLCSVHVFLDHDRAGISASSRAESEGLLATADRNFATSPGMRESEFEDLIDPSLYTPALKRIYNVDLMANAAFRRRARKWSDRVESAFLAGGQTWSPDICKNVKTVISDLIVQDAENALHPAWRSSFDGLASIIEVKLDAVEL